MQICDLLQHIEISEFSEVMTPYRKLVEKFDVFVDGGAGLGETAAKMMKALPDDDFRIIAFEPNGSNVEAFRETDKRITLIPKAMGAENGQAEFFVSQNTQRTSDTNKYLVLGTSFVGRLSLQADAKRDGARYLVDVVPMAETLRDMGLSSADFIKLDLQGGELDALKGAGDLLKSVQWMWIEYGGQPGLLNFLKDSDFILFDTEYLFSGEPTESVLETFTITRSGTNSINRKIFFGRRKKIWFDYEERFKHFRKEGMIQTDLVAVSPRYIEAFTNACIEAWRMKKAAKK